MKKLRHVTVTLCIGLDSRPRSKRWTPDVMHQRHVVDQSRRWTAFNCVARVGLAVSLIHSYSVVGYSIYLREHWFCSKDNYVAPGCLLKCAVNPMFTDHFSRSSRVIGQVCVCPDNNFATHMNYALARCPSVCLSHDGSVLKRLTKQSTPQPKGLYFSLKVLGYISLRLKFQWGHHLPLIGATYTLG